VTGIITYLAVKNTNKRAEKREAQNRHEEQRKLQKEKQWDIFSKLKGIQSSLPQDYLDYYINKVASLYQEAAARLHSEKENQRLHLEESRSLHARSYENGRFFAKDRRELYEIIGLIQILFPNKPQLNKKINPIYLQLIPFESEFNQEILRNELEILIPGIFGDLRKWVENFEIDKVGENFKKINEWRATKVKRINKLATENVSQQLEDLLIYLQAEMLIDLNDWPEEIRAKSWWQFWK